MHFDDIHYRNDGIFGTVMLLRYRNSAQTKIGLFLIDLKELWPPQPTSTWLGAEFVKLTDVTSALSTLTKGYRKPPLTSNFLPKMPKILKEKQKHLSDTLKESEEDLEEATVVTKKLGLLGSLHNKKIARALQNLLKNKWALKELK